ncbi:hypothetical protein C0J09_07450 [Bordetella avium]|nr:hypothetical protein C0J09_07450 [Bordetella avium]
MQRFDVPWSQCVPALLFSRKSSQRRCAFSEGVVLHDLLLGLRRAGGALKSKPGQAGKIQPFAGLADGIRACPASGLRPAGSLAA